MAGPLNPEQQRAQRQIDDLEDQLGPARAKVDQLRQQRAACYAAGPASQAELAAWDRELGAAARVVDDLENDIRNLKLRHGLQ